MQALLSAALADGAVGLPRDWSICPAATPRHEESPRWPPSPVMRAAFTRPISAMKATRSSKAFRKPCVSPRRPESRSNSPITNVKAGPTGASRRLTLPMMAQAREAGLDVLTDQYPYTAFMTGLMVILLPALGQRRHMEDTLLRLRDPLLRERILPKSPRSPGTGTRCRSASPATGARRRA